MEHLGLLMLRGITDVDDSFFNENTFVSKNESLVGHFEVTVNAWQKNSSVSK